MKETDYTVFNKNTGDEFHYDSYSEAIKGIKNLTGITTIHYVRSWSDGKCSIIEDIGSHAWFIKKTSKKYERT